MPTPRWVAFLRAINVGGRTVKMDRLKVLFTEMGFKNVETFIASGNVLFDSTLRSVTAIEDRIEAGLYKALGYDVATFVRPLAALGGVSSAHPYADQEPNAHGLYIGFLRQAPSAPGLEKLAKLESPDHSFFVNGAELYWLSRVPMSESKISNAALEKALGSPATFRSVTTVRKLAAKAPR